MQELPLYAITVTYAHTSLHTWKYYKSLAMYTPLAPSVTCNIGFIDSIKQNVSEKSPKETHFGITCSILLLSTVIVLIHLMQLCNFTSVHEKSVYWVLVWKVGGSGNNQPLSLSV